MPGMALGNLTQVRVSSLLPLLLYVPSARKMNRLIDRIVVILCKDSNGCLVLVLHLIG